MTSASVQKLMSVCCCKINKNYVEGRNKRHWAKDFKTVAATATM